MRTTSKIWTGLTALITVAAAVWLAYTPHEKSGEGPYTLSFYTAPSATTPQLPFWAAYRQGFFTNSIRIETHLWKDLDDLQGFMLAGKGDVWLGHIEGFARARRRGAPVVLLAVTGWRKFYFVSRHPLDGVDDLADRTVPYTPVGAPVIPLLNHLLSDHSAPLFVPREWLPLADTLRRGRADIALAPEPLVSLIQRDMPEFQYTLAVADVYADIDGGAARLPVAGIAVHEELLRTRPEWVASLMAGMRKGADWLNDNPSRALDVLPEDFASALPQDVLLSSLKRDRPLVEAAVDVRHEIKRYLSLAAPDLFESYDETRWAEHWIWKERVP